MNYFLSRRRTSLITCDKVTELRGVNSDIPQGSPISPLLFLIYLSALYNKIREIGNHAAGFINDNSIHKGGRGIDKSTATLIKVLQICHVWGQEYYPEFDCGGKLGLLHIQNLERERPRKKEKAKSNMAYSTDYRLRKTICSEEFKITGIDAWL